MFGVCRVSSRISSRSCSERGRSELTARRAAPTSGSQFSEVDLWYLKTLPSPGVSTSRRLAYASREGSSMSTRLTFFRLPGFFASEVKSAISSRGIGVTEPSKCLTMARSRSPYWSLVMAVVTGIAPTGRTSLQMRLLMNELFPALNWPRMATSIGGFWASRLSLTSSWRLRETS